MRPNVGPMRSVARTASRPLTSVWRSLIGETRGLVRDTTFAGLGQGATILGAIGQIMIISHVLGLEAFGTFALTVAFVHLVSRFFDLNAEYMLIAFGAAKLRRSKKAAAGVIQFGAIADAASGVVGFVAVAILASSAGERLAGSQGPELFLLFGVTLLVSTLDGTSASTLQLFGRFGLIAGYQVVGEVSRLIAIGVGLLISESLIAVVGALVVHDAVMAVIGAAMALTVFRRTTGLSLLRPALSTVKADVREMLKMLVHTNVVAYARLAETHLPTLLVGSFHGPLQAGLFKVGMAPAGALGKVKASASSAATPRLARLVNSARADLLRPLILQASVIALVVIGGLGAVLIVLRVPILELIGGEEATAASAVLVFAVLGQVVSGSLFWNSNLLFAARNAKTVSKLYVASVVVSIPVLVFFADRWGATGAAAALLISAIQINVLLALAAWRLASKKRPGPRADRGPRGSSTPGVPAVHE